MSGQSHLETMMVFGEALLMLATGCLSLVKISLQLEPASATNLPAILLSELKTFPAFGDFSQLQGLSVPGCYVTRTHLL